MARRSSTLRKAQRSRSLKTRRNKKHNTTKRYRLKKNMKGCGCSCKVCQKCKRSRKMRGG